MREYRRMARPQVAKLRARTGGYATRSRAKGGTVMAVAVMTGQHTGVFNGIAPTGRSITHKQVHIFTVAPAA
jgi:hypothetical protein